MRPDREALDNPLRYKREDASKHEPDINDPCMTLKEFAALIQRLVNKCGGSTIIQADAGFNNVGFLLYKKIPPRPKVTYERHSCLGCRAWFKTRLFRDRHRATCKKWKAVVAAVKEQTGSQ